MDYNIVCHGNSITLGATQTPYPSQLDSLLSASEAVYNKGTGGAISQELYDEFDAVVQPLYSSGLNNIVIFWEASNALTQTGYTAEDEKTIQQQYITKAQSQGWKVVVASVIQRGVSINLATWRVEIVKFNDWLELNSRTLADGFLDVWSLNTDLQNEFDGNGPVASYIDAAHLNTARYADIAAEAKLELEVVDGVEIGVYIAGVRNRVWAAYEGKTFSLDGINYYKDNVGIGDSVAAIGLTSYT